MITDCHTHFNSSAGRTDIAAHLDACQKVDSCIVLADLAESSEKTNKLLSDFVKDQPKMHGFAVFDPLRDKPTAKNIKSLTRGLGHEGVVLYCCQGKFHPAHSRAMRFYEAANDLDLPVFFHNCPPYSSDAVLDFAQPYLIDEIAVKFPSLKIIIGGMGPGFLSQTISMIEKHENVYADLTISPEKTWQVYNLVLSCHEAGVMEKLFFGSGYPSANPGECIETLLGFNKLMANTSLPNVPREEIRSVIERDTLSILGINSD